MPGSLDTLNRGALAVASGDGHLGLTGVTAGFYNLANRGDPDTPWRLGAVFTARR